ncbi:uncharacterized protein SPPG_05501 [Spizellomyces punctatus DAOM BR117]|uniref:Uncharacterized protein n=1 Tax=Spizellomyces punctatus (strain DAOM BR117) TaxID=645134 RepID=A0A0L0HCH7_SPIPD|nr:uncharacterized protein SPPG_05501 [Spizellomyces punctatus DAOM BR117]KNC99245.1 hypothetical protein SPPG_05501 [Spizellomyces punctatus DAOM BR117]|eukprot:XP_016607285.1 hypothetical protein SPPG_05501 [Spizellomyces punctatus DAOM BR117]
MWDAGAYDVNSANGYDPSYYGAEWNGYQDVGDPAPPGVDPAPPGVDQAQGWSTTGQQWAEHTESGAQSGVPTASTIEPVVETSSVSTLQAPDSNGKIDPPSAVAGAAAAIPSEGAEATASAVQGDWSQYQGYDYTAYSGYGYYDPNTAYYGTAGYQYTGQAYGQYYGTAYAAAAAAPKEIHNPFEEMKKKQVEEAKPVEKKVVEKRKVVVIRPKLGPKDKHGVKLENASDQEKLDSTEKEPSASNGCANGHNLQNVIPVARLDKQPEQGDVSVQAAQLDINDQVDKLVKEVHAARSLKEDNGRTAKKEPAARAMADETSKPTGAGSLEVALQEKENITGGGDGSLKYGDRAGSIKDNDAEVRAPRVNGEKILEEAADMDVDPSDDDELVLTDSDEPKALRSRVLADKRAAAANNRVELRIGQGRTSSSAAVPFFVEGTDVNGDTKGSRVSMTSKQISSRNAAAEALAAARAAAANINKREGYRDDHRPRRGRGRDRYTSRRYGRYRRSSRSPSMSRSRSRSRSRPRSRSMSKSRSPDRRRHSNGRTLSPSNLSAGDRSYHSKRDVPRRRSPSAEYRPSQTNRDAKGRRADVHEFPAYSHHTSDIRRGTNALGRDGEERPIRRRSRSPLKHSLAEPGLSSDSASESEAAIGIDAAKLSRKEGDKSGERHHRDSSKRSKHRRHKSSRSSRTEKQDSDTESLQPEGKLLDDASLEADVRREHKTSPSSGRKEHRSSKHKHSRHKSSRHKSSSSSKREENEEGRHRSRRKREDEETHDERAKRRRELDEKADSGITVH